MGCVRRRGGCGLGGGVPDGQRDGGELAVCGRLPSVGAQRKVRLPTGALSACGVVDDYE
jgi:hypothetical protein